MSPEAKHCSCKILGIKTNKLCNNMPYENTVNNETVQLWLPPEGDTHAPKRTLSKYPIWPCSC